MRLAQLFFHASVILTVAMVAIGIGCASSNAQGDLIAEDSPSLTTDTRDELLPDSNQVTDTVGDPDAPTSTDPSIRDILSPDDATNSTLDTMSSLDFTPTFDSTVSDTDSDDASDAPECSPPALPTCPETACGTVTELTDEAALKAFLAAAPWHENAAWCAVSDEVHFAGPLSVQAADIAAPNWCDEPPCAPVFQLLTPVPGITCTEPMNHPSKFCPEIRIDQAQFRVRPGRWVSQGFVTTITPVLGIVGPCDASCAENEATCPNHTCFPVPMADYSPFHCLLCRGGDDQMCGCWGEQGPVADGTPCGWVQGGVALNGHCKCGQCTLP